MRDSSDDVETKLPRSCVTPVFVQQLLLPLRLAKCHGPSKDNFSEAMWWSSSKQVYTFLCLHFLVSFSPMSASSCTHLEEGCLIRRSVVVGSAAQTEAEGMHGGNADGSASVNSIRCLHGPTFKKSGPFLKSIFCAILPTRHSALLLSSSIVSQRQRTELYSRCAVLAPCLFTCTEAVV